MPSVTSQSGLQWLRARATDLSLDYWRHLHAAHYSPHLEEWGIADIEEATVITEHFTIVFRQPHG
jgi:extradiol dioxygenase family protein